MPTGIRKCPISCRSLAKHLLSEQIRTGHDSNLKSALHLKTPLTRKNLFKLIAIAPIHKKQKCENFSKSFIYLCFRRRATTYIASPPGHCNAVLVLSVIGESTPHH